MKTTAAEKSGGRAPRVPCLPMVLLLQLLAFAAIGAGIYFIAKMEYVQDFYGAHRGVASIHKLLLPAVLTSGGLGYLVVAIVTWLGFRSCARKAAAPIERSEALLQRLARGDLAFDAAAAPAGGGDVTIDATAAEVARAYREKVVEFQKLGKEIHSSVLSLRYKASGEEPLTRTEIQQIAGSLDILCKRMHTSTKWFET